MRNSSEKNSELMQEKEFIILAGNCPGYTVGGKAKNLFFLREHGFNVPEFIVIPAEVLLALFPQNLMDEEDIDGIKSFINSVEIPGELIQRITGQFSDTAFYSVRSSAIDEDGGKFSFAGQFDSYLYVTKEQIAEKIKKVWLSAFNERVVKYRKENNLSLKFSIAVIIQKMIDADAAGVAFGANPANGDRKQKVISAVYGVGEGLVSGELDADTFYLKENKTGSYEIERVIVKKEKKRVFDKTSGSGSVLENVTGEKITLQCLSDEKIIEIANSLDKLKNIYKTFQDIEFAVKDNKLFLLQARPVTSLSQLPDINGEYIVWDNSNIIESYPGVTTPLTFSFILPVYEAVYRQFVAMMGVKQHEIDENKEVFANMLGLLNGRVYYNLLSWYKALAMLPGYSLNAEFMEKMMGVKEKFVLKEVKKSSKFRERLRVLSMVRLMIKNLRALPAMRTNFVTDFNATMKEYSAIDFSKCSADELMSLYLKFEQTLLKKWKAPLVNDFFAMIYYGVLQKLVVKYNIPDASTIHNDLLCGAKDIISTEPIKRSLEIATAVSKNESLKNVFLHKSEKDIMQELKKDEHKKVAGLVKEYIDKFGERCVGELKLETITYKQNPNAFIRIIKSYVQQGITNENSAKEHDVEIRSNAEQKVSKALGRKFFRRRIFNYFLKKSRDLVSARENLRYERTRAFGVVRQIFCALGENFYAEGLINEPRDVFYFTKEEIFHYIKGTSVNYDLKALCDLRKKQFGEHESQMLAGKNTSERIKSYGVVYLGNKFRQEKSNEVLKGDLKGIPCCAGKVRAKVRVVRSPDEVENLNGDILVTSSTDPGWVTLFPTASAILVERGSLLSHSAIVSREMGKPCIVGITGLLEVLKSGDEVEMDGSTGVVKLLTMRHVASLVDTNV